MDEVTIMEFKILRCVRRVQSKLKIQNFRKADFNQFRHLLGRVLLDKAIGMKRPRKLVNIQGSPPPNSEVIYSNKEDVGQKYQEESMEEQVKETN